jgi:signal transduction histidine kinase
LESSAQSERASRYIEVHLESRQDPRKQRNGMRPSSKQATVPGDPLPDVDTTSNASTPRHFGWWPIVVLMLLSAVTATAATVSHQLTVTRAGLSAPGEGLSWHVAQYEIANQRLKQELRAVAAGEPANEKELSRRAKALASWASILVGPSQTDSPVNREPGVVASIGRLSELQHRVGPMLEKARFSQLDAVKVLGEFQALGDEELLSRLANDVRAAEINAKDAVARSLSRRISWAWSGFALCWTVLALWLLHVLRSRRRFQTAANDRQRAADTLEQALIAKRKFLSMVNHEVRSPLQNIVASAELLATKEHRPESVAAIRRIQHAVTVLQGQLRDLLTIARGDSGQMPMQAETFDMGDMVRDVCADFHDSADAKGLAYKVECPPQPMPVSADPIRIAQVLRNLVENAVRYTSTGKVHVRLEPFLNDASPANGTQSAAGTVRFVVCDSGPGLPTVALERLKSAAVPFESSSDGTSIGLFVIRDVLQQLGGSIDVQTRDAAHPDRMGTIVTVSIPALQVPDSAPIVNSGELAESLSVLVVDDLLDVRDALTDVARRLGHTCLAAGTAAEARPLLASTPFDAVLIDLEMPDVDGRALATEIRQGNGINAATMLILISAAENQAAGQVWPFDGFLQKPIDGIALARLIGSHR